MYDIIILSGGFDPVHKGHVRMIQSAAKNCNLLIVGVNSDAWLRRKKKKEFMQCSERKEIISAFEGVAEVLSFDDTDNSASDLIRKIRKSYPSSLIAFGNGGDRVQDNVPEVQTCLECNVEMIWNIGGEKIQSSSDLIKNSRIK